jgi:hypothetical protein
MGQKPTIVVNTPIREIDEYRRLVKQVSRLTRHGRVEVNISGLAEKSRYELPPGGSPWHEYAACNPTPAKFFPDEMLEPFLPPDSIEKNRELLLAKVAVLREEGLGAAFWSYEPNFLPEAFFRAYPALRGPRTDHPRRSRREEFAPCVDADESRAMTTRMVRKLVEHVPELGTYFFKTNDAGPGLCWSDWQYSGPNGPERCRHRAMGDRVRGLVDSILQGGEQAGAELTVHLTGNFSSGEAVAIESKLPDNTFLRGADPTGDRSVAIGTCADQLYPVRGVLDLIGTLNSLNRLQAGNIRTVFVDLRSFYDRSYERLDTSEKMIEVIDGFLAKPAFGPIAILQRAREICHRWVGPQRGDALFEAMIELHECLKYKKAALPRLSAIYGGVSLRYITRPLLVLPERLTAEEERYFLPHVFNVSHERARTDYIDVHGTRLCPEWMCSDSTDPRVWAIDALRSRLNRVATTIEGVAGVAGDADGGDAECWRKMGTALRVFGNVLRSCGNFFAVQIARDRHAERFAAPPDLPPARSVVAGHPDLTLLNELMRDELDNTAETLALLQREGLDVLSHAASPSDEDTFLLGPDLLAQLQQKQTLMSAHWRDAEGYFFTPNR